MNTVNCATCKALIWEDDVPIKKSGNCWRCEVKRLYNALKFIARTCTEDPGTAKFALRVIEGSIQLPKKELTYIPPSTQKK